MIYCKYCNNMFIITYFYKNSEIYINCECPKENKEETISIESFLNRQTNQTMKITKCITHNLSYSYWCISCKENICDLCEKGSHKNHQIKLLKKFLPNSTEIFHFEKTIKKFKKKLNEDKDLIKKENLFEKSEEKKFYKNFQNFYDMNQRQIDFINIIKDSYSELNKNLSLCYQCIINLNYLIDKLKKSNDNSNNDSINSIKSISDIYSIVFNIEKFSLLPDDSSKEIDKEVKNIRDAFNYERTCITSYKKRKKSISINDNQKNEEMIIDDNDNIISNSVVIENYFDNKINNSESKYFMPKNSNYSIDSNNSKTININNIFNNRYNDNINKTINENDIDNSSNNAMEDNISESNFFLLNSNNNFSKQLLPENNDPFNNEQFNQININETSINISKISNLCQNQNQSNIKNTTQKYNNKSSKIQKITYPDGSIYEGEIKNGLRHGYGILTNENGDLYQGNWANDKREGKCFEIKNGDTFEGFYINDIRNGKCIINYKNGDKFEGILVNGMKEGYGIQTDFEKQSEYKGDFKNNLFEGNGEIITKNGYYFKGQFLHGLRHGDKCIEKKEGFKKYEGQFRRDKMNGEGIFEWFSGNAKGDIYKGQFKDDLFDGKGFYRYSNGNTYIGEYLNGKKHGKGKEIYYDGSVYEGDFKNGEKTGKGKFEDYEGNIYEGNFFNGYKHSIGKITFANGDVLEGLWMYDKIEGNAYFTSKDGKCYLDKYIEGQLIERKEQGFFNSFLKKIYSLIS